MGKENVIKTNILRMEGTHGLTPIHVTITIGNIVQGLLSKFGNLSQKTIEARVCACCSLNDGACQRRRTSEGIRFTLPGGVDPKKAFCLHKHVIHR